LTFATYYQDLDDDGFGAGTSVFTCSNPGLGYVNQGGDCDDANPAMYPLNAEVCDDLDNNCDGLVDNGVSFTNYFVDNDGDGFGVGLPVSVCVDPGAGYSLTANDCDDNNATIYPNSTELCDGIDNDCDGSSDEGLTFVTYYTDQDGDAYGLTTSAESLCQNPGVGYVTTGGDCNDLSNLFNPSIAEVCDGLDNDCDGTNDNGLTFATYYQDLDDDGFGAGTSVFTCANPGLGYVNQGGDCDDANPAMYPLNAEICDDLDNNCDGLVDNVR